jgi:hypothetical protein
MLVGISNHNPLDLIEDHLVAPAIVELRRARRGVVRHRGGLFECAAVLEIGGDPGCAKAVVPELRLDPAIGGGRAIINTNTTNAVANDASITRGARLAKIYRN